MTSNAEGMMKLFILNFICRINKYYLFKTKITNNQISIIIHLEDKSQSSKAHFHNLCYDLSHLLSLPTKLLPNLLIRSANLQKCFSVHLKCNET